MGNHVHCVVCGYSAFVKVRRFKKIGFEPVCEWHFMWLEDNCRRPFTTRRILFPCGCEPVSTRPGTAPEDTLDRSMESDAASPLIEAHVDPQILAASER